MVRVNTYVYVCVPREEGESVCTCKGVGWVGYVYVRERIHGMCNIVCVCVCENHTTGHTHTGNAVWASCACAS